MSYLSNQQSTLMDRMSHICLWLDQQKIFELMDKFERKYY